MCSKIIVYKQKPNDFISQVEIAATYVNSNGKLLLLQLAQNKQEKGFWGVPAGKLEINEIPLKGAKRELFEETGIDADMDHFLPLGELYIRKPDIGYVYHLFTVNFDTQPFVTLSKEHVLYKWVSRNEAESLPLMQGAHQALDAYYNATCIK